MSLDDCGKCDVGEYLCPSDQRTCVCGADGYGGCPGMAGTHLDASLSEDARLAYLSSHTSLEEKASQLTNAAPELRSLGIPAFQWLNDDEHGVGRTKAKATIFPSGCGLGATWSHETLGQVGVALGDEARGLHAGFLASDPSRSMKCNGCGPTLYAPNINLVRDPRWGRAQEVFGEDPHLMSRLGVALIIGAQGNTPGSPVGPDGKRIRVAMCCKHFAAYNTEAKCLSDARVDSRDFWETYMPAFRACAVEARATHVMCSYNAVNGVPTCASKGLLTGVLRDTWDFDGFVVGDYDEWEHLYPDGSNCTHVTADATSAAAMGLNAGLDQEGGGTFISSSRRYHA